MNQTSILIFDPKNNKAPHSQNFEVYIENPEKEKVSAVKLAEANIQNNWHTLIHMARPL
jgi:hypothetical protein